MNAPQRFDLEESSCVNRDKGISQKTKKIMERYHTKVIDMSTNRDHYSSPYATKPARRVLCLVRSLEVNDPYQQKLSECERPISA